MSRKIQIKRGTRADLPILDVGEFGFCIDTEELFIGGESGNVVINEWINDLDKNSSDSAYVIELERWGIEQGSFGKPPYTNEEWEVAYNNMIGFNNALEYAYSKGYSLVTLPKGTYSYCYTSYTTETGTNSWGTNTAIVMKSNMTLDLNGSIIEVMYDSDNSSPYDDSAREPWRLGGTVFRFNKCINSHLINGEIKGDIFNRSFSSTGSGLHNYEGGTENTSGIAIDRGCEFCSIRNMNIHHFMGDSISIGCSPNDTGTWYLAQNPLAYPNYIDNTGNAMVKSGCYVTDFIKVNPHTEHQEIVLRCGLGYTRIPRIKNKTFEYIFYDENKNYLSRKYAVYLQTIVVPHNARHFRLQFVGEDEGLEIFNVLNNFMIAKPQSSHILVQNCRLHDNHRGGISGGADFSYIHNNKIYHNGLDSSLGIELFPDSTRYAINFEDSYSNYVSIKNNEFYSGYNGVILGAFHTSLSGNIFSEFTVAGIGIYRNAHSHIEENIFHGCRPLMLEVEESDYEYRTINFINNRVESGGANWVVDTTIYPKTLVKVKDNIVFMNNFSMKGNVEVENNLFRLYSKYMELPYSNVGIQGVVKCINNTFEGYNVEGLRFHFDYYDLGLSYNNIFRNCLIGSSFYPNDIDAIADSTFINSTLSLQYKTPTSNSHFTLKNCNFIDTTINFGGQYLANNTALDVVYGITFDFCNFSYSPNYTRRTIIGTLDSVLHETSRRRSSINIKNSKISIQKTNYLRFIKYNSSDNESIDPIGSHRTLTLDNSKLNFADTTNFKWMDNTNATYHSNYRVILRDCDSNISFGSGAIGLIEIYNKPLKGMISNSIPTTLELQVGMQWFNTTNNKPYWWDGTTWKDSQGVEL